MLFEGDLHKMHTKYAQPIQYALNQTLVNDWIGRYIEIRHTDNIHCIKCGVKTLESYAQGFCYDCFTTAPETSLCIIHPELCQAHLGIGRDMEWERKYHLKPHIVYLAISSNLKVGITTQTQLPTRWIDQGASQAICIAITPYRYLCGCIEVALKDHLADKTNWQKMLRNDINKNIDLINEAKRIQALIPEDLQQYCTPHDQLKVFNIEYPHTNSPRKIQSKNLSKTPIVEGVLTGIKGQYFIFEDGQVMNIRKHSGYEVQIAAVSKTTTQQLSLF
ncbi:MAG: DUF2797 domain-containing protein [Cytophagales bacterium]|nr:DUF2797 domain-containing protein [Cytophagales bacterium]